MPAIKIPEDRPIFFIKASSAAKTGKGEISDHNDSGPVEPQFYGLMRANLIQGDLDGRLFLKNKNPFKHPLFHLYDLSKNPYKPEEITSPHPLRKKYERRIIDYLKKNGIGSSS